MVGVLFAAGCSRSPEAQKARYLERGDTYAGREQHLEEILEYRNVLRIDPANARAARQLGLLHYKLGEIGQAFPYLLKAGELAPDAHDVRLKLGTIYLLAGKTDEARREVTFVLEKEPKNLDGLALLAAMATTPEELDDAIRRLEAAQVDLGDRAKLHMALGTLYSRKRDVARAERAFQEAVAKEPKSVEAHLALGTFYVDKRDLAQAEREFKMAADIAPIGSPTRMRLSNFYFLVQRPDEAKRILSEITQKAPDYLPAWRRLAEIALDEGNYDESLKALQPVLKKNPSDLEGRLLQGRVRLAKHETTDAIQDFQHVLKLEPRNALAHYQLGLAQLQTTSNLQQAKAELKEATSIAPDFTEAVLLLAELNIQAGAVQPAIEDLERLIARPPTIVRAYALLGTAFLVKREPAKATATYRMLKTRVPKDPRGPLLVGLGLRAEGKIGEAKKEFEAALALDPGHVDAAHQLIIIALADKQPDDALSRLTKQIALAPKSGGLQHLLGMLYLARREPALAEGAFLRAIELEPRLTESYIALGNLYRVSGRYNEAVAKLDQALNVDPRNASAQMLLAVLHEGKGELAKAQQGYERILALDPRFAPAANNLAWLYSEHGGDKEKALELAQRAKQAAPEDPHISDTLGWILYQRGVYQRAMSLLKESAARLPDSPVIQYHLGMASLKAGDKDGARKALIAALNSPGNFEGREEARRALSELN